MGLLKTDKLPKGEKGLAQALAKNKKFEEHKDYVHFDALLEQALKYRKGAKEGFSTYLDTWKTVFSAREQFSKASFYKKGDLFVWRYTDGEVCDDGKNLKIMSKVYYVINKNEQGRYEISCLEVKFFEGKAVGTVRLDIGTDNSKWFFDVNLRSKTDSRMTSQDREKYEKLLVDAHQIESAESKSEKNITSRKSNTPKGSQAEATKGGASKKVERESSKEATSGEEMEM